MSRLAKYLEQRKQQEWNSAAIAQLAALDHIEQTAPEISAAIEHELLDQRSRLKLIASENYSSLAVQLAMGNLLTDKYAEGFPGHRFYAGCENVDTVENEARNRLKKLFGAACAYVQPHSGADANLIAFWSVLVQRVQNKEVERLGRKKLEELTPEEYEALRQTMMNQKIMGMSLNSGGHLTHGYLHNLSSKMFRSVPYDVERETERLDFKKLAEKVKQEKPLILLAGYSSYPRKINFANMREIADSVGAVLIVDMAHFSGLVAGKAFTGEFDPVPFAHIVTSTTHKTLRGPRGGFILCQKEFEQIVNKGCPLVMGGPLPHVIAAKAIAFKEADTEEFQRYAARVVENAQHLAERLASNGVRVITGGTENHIVVFDVSSFHLTGKQAESALGKAHITVNRNAIPYDANGPWYTSGIRVGTPALTTLGMQKQEMAEVADIIVDLLKHTQASCDDNGNKSLANCTSEKSALANAQARVKDLLAKFPLYPEIACCVESVSILK